MSGKHSIRLTLIGPGKTKDKSLYQCVCGNRKEIRRAHVTAGRSTSCGCLRREMLSELRTSHGHTASGRSRAYNTWRAMKARCYNKKNNRYPLYGKRGITVCQQWKDSFEVFLKDMGDPPVGTSLDRINVNGNYEPGNCRWADRLTQARNKSAAEFRDLAGSAAGE